MKKLILLIIILLTYFNINAQFIEYPKYNCGGVKPDGLVSWCQNPEDTYYSECGCNWEKEREKYDKKTQIVKNDIDNKFNQIGDLESKSEILFTEAIDIEKNLENSQSFESDKNRAITNLQKSISNYEKIISLSKQIDGLYNRLSRYRKDSDLQIRHTQISFYKGIIERINKIKKSTGEVSIANNSNNYSSNNQSNSDSNSSTSNNNNNSYSKPSNSSKNNKNSTSSNSNNETVAEKTARLDRERGEQIMQETQANIARVNKSSDEIGNELTGMFQNGVTPQGFFNMSESFYGLNSNTGSIAGGISSLAGHGVQLVNAFKAERDENIAFNLKRIENNSKKREEEYKNIAEAASNNDHNKMFAIHKNLVKLDATLMVSCTFLERKHRDKSMRPKFSNFKNTIKTEIINRLTLFQELETNKFIKNVIDNKLSSKDFIDSYINLGHSIYNKTLIDDNHLSNRQTYKTYERTGVFYTNIIDIEKFVNWNAYNEFSYIIKKARSERYQKLYKTFGNSKYQNALTKLYFTEESYGQIALYDYGNNSNDKKTFTKKELSTYFNALTENEQKELLELILFKTIPKYQRGKVKISKPYTYKNSYYDLSFIKVLLLKDFNTNIHMKVQSPYNDYEVSLHDAIVQRMSLIKTSASNKSDILSRLNFLEAEISYKNKEYEKALEYLALVKKNANGDNSEKNNLEILINERLLAKAEYLNLPLLKKNYNLTTKYVENYSDNESLKLIDDLSKKYKILIDEYVKPEKPVKEKTTEIQIEDKNISDDKNISYKKTKKSYIKARPGVKSSLRKKTVNNNTNNVKQKETYKEVPLKQVNKANEINIAPDSLDTTKSRIYFYRTSFVGAVIKFSYYDGEKNIGKSKAGEVIKYECDPGEHHFGLIYKSLDGVCKPEFITINLEPNQEYYIKAIVKDKYLLKEDIAHNKMIRKNKLNENYKGSFHIVNLANYPSELSKTKSKIDKKIPLIFSNEELKEYQEEYLDIISNTFEKYTKSK